ncbi:glycosyltransferase family 2 protein [Streptomyces sp. YIM 98790]|uniref:glycosyltransferase family 2 protein n=1 Tax=Streptomyces sp. YIM 98790 TaxID=2689077 RepID=UPI00140C5A35|nr:glycosyltransferase family 2 protein [Streptomyces sp. YIM 98790]
MSAQSAHPEFPQHVVTAVLVAHDGARWLPDVLTGLSGQERQVQDVIAADTGSADSSAALLTERLGPDRVLHLARRTTFGAAVAEAARTAPVLTPDDLRYLRRPDAWDPVTRTWDTSAYDLPELPFGEPVHWLWLLHDDSAPEPGALRELLRQADADPDAAVIGPKLRGWYDRRQLLETGVTIAPSGRRWTGLERREQDQGQHDLVRPVLAVSSAGMLIRRDVFERLGGFDRRLPLMRDDVDLCWRAHAAGYRVIVAPDAVLRHAEAAARERRSIDCAGRLGGSPHRVDKAAAAYTLLTNARGRALPWALLRLVLGTLLRILGYLLGKAPGHALDEAAGLLATLLRPGRILKGRRDRRHTTAADFQPAGIRTLFPPPGATVRATVEQAVTAVTSRTQSGGGPVGRHGGGRTAVESGPTDDSAEDFEVEQFVWLRRLARRPGPVLFALLLLLSFLACRSLLGGGALGGGALLPAPGDAGALWDRYLTTWQPLGTGGSQAAPPYLAFLAMPATALLGSTGAVMTGLVVLAVPLAGISAYLCSKPLLPSRVLRAWGAVAYALLPALTGALATGRIGTVVLAVLLPPLARCAVSTTGLVSGAARGPWRAAWAGALLLTVTTAFTPVVWPLTAVLGLAVLALPLRQPPGARRARGLRLAALLLTPALLLSPWSWRVLLSPDRFLSEAGLPYPTDPASAAQLLTLSPGGPGTTGAWILTGLLLAALAALLRRDRRAAVTTAWGAALIALLFAVWSNDGDHWAGPAVLVYSLALLCAAAVGADGARARVAEQSFGWRQPVAALTAVAAAAGPLLALAGWAAGGVGGPLERRSPVQVPAFVAEESSTSDQARTLMLASEGDTADGTPQHVRYVLVRGAGARLGDGDLTELMPEDDALGRAVADLVAGTGADQTAVLSDYAVRYVLVRQGSSEGLQQVLDATPGLKRLSQEDGSPLWRVQRDTSRVTVLPAEQPAGEPGEEAAGEAAENDEAAQEEDTAGGDAPAAPGEPLALPAGPIEVRTELPDGPAGRILRLADAADPGWVATVDGSPLKSVKLDGWAQGFELPEGGGLLEVTYDSGSTHTAWVWTQGFLLLVLTVLALPGRRRELDDDLPEEAGGSRAQRPAAAPERERPAPPAAPAEEPAREPEPEPEPAGAAVPQQQSWFDPASGAATPGYQQEYGHQESGGYSYDSYPQPGYDPGGYGAGQPYPAEQYPAAPSVPGQNQGEWDSGQDYGQYDYGNDYGDGGRR